MLMNCGSSADSGTNPNSTPYAVLSRRVQPVIVPFVILFKNTPLALGLQSSIVQLLITKFLLVFTM